VSVTLCYTELVATNVTVYIRIFETAEVFPAVYGIGLSGTSRCIIASSPVKMEI